MTAKVATIHLQSIDSTQTYAKTHYHAFDQSRITRITAEEQTGGRGRLGRSWFSPSGVNLYLTYFFTLTKKGNYPLSNFSQILSLSIANLLTEQRLSPQIKWPNDLLINGKKIAGVLAELIDLKERWGVIIGAGININMAKEACDAIDQEATSLLIEMGKEQNREELLPLLDELFLADCALYQERGFAPFAARYAALLALRGKKITLKSDGKVIEGTLLGVGERGEVQLYLPSGGVGHFYSGDIARPNNNALFSARTKRLNRIQ